MTSGTSAFHDSSVREREREREGKGARVGCMGSVTDVDGNDVMTGEESGNKSKDASAPEGSSLEGNEMLNLRQA